MLASIFALMFAIFPASFAIFLLAVFAILVVLLFLKIAKYVLDAIPFL